MRKKQIFKIKENILLSIKYAGLKEELKRLENLSNKLEVKKQDKVINNIINVKKIINNIEQNYSPNSYLLVVNNKLDNELKKLAKRKDLELIKYEVVTELVIDEEFDQDSYKDYFKKISKILFANEKEVNDIQSTYKTLKKVIDVNKDNISDAAGAEIGKGIVKMAAGILNVHPAIQAVAAVGVPKVIEHVKFKRKVKKEVSLSAINFRNKLAIYGISLIYAKKIFKDNKEQLKVFYNKIYNKLNYERNFLMKQMFNENFKVGETAYKIWMFQNFDNYFINILIKQEGK